MDSLLETDTCPYVPMPDSQPPRPSCVSPRRALRTESSSCACEKLDKKQLKARAKREQLAAAAKEAAADKAAAL